MRQSLGGLLHHVIDYAGIFPPSQLPLDEAFASYQKFKVGPESHVTGRFVCSSTKLNELSALIPVSVAEPYAISVVGRASSDRATWEEALMSDAATMNAFSQDTEGRAAIVGYEMRVPDHEGIESWLRDLRGFDLVDLFVELPWGEGLRDSLAAISEYDGLGAKARTGGVVPTAFPAPQSLAIFLHGCSSLEVPFKLTAGLHHPLWHHNEALDVKMHGFVNALTATVLAIAEDASTNELVDVLKDGDSSHWTFDNNGFSYGDHRLSLESIEDARALFVAFGSCSIDEPLTDLAALGWVEEQI